MTGTMEELGMMEDRRLARNLERLWEAAQRDVFEPAFLSRLLDWERDLSRLSTLQILGLNFLASIQLEGFKRQKWSENLRSFS